MLLSALAVHNEAIDESQDVYGNHRGAPPRDESPFGWSLGWGLEAGAEGRAFWHWGDNPVERLLGSDHPALAWLASRYQAATTPVRHSS